MPNLSLHPWSPFPHSPLADQHILQIQATNIKQRMQADKQNGALHDCTLPFLLFSWAGSGNNSIKHGAGLLKKFQTVLISMVRVSIKKQSREFYLTCKDQSRPFSTVETCLHLTLIHIQTSLKSFMISITWKTRSFRCNQANRSCSLLSSPTHLTKLAVAFHSPLVFMPHGTFFHRLFEHAVCTAWNILWELLQSSYYLFILQITILIFLKNIPSSLHFKVLITELRI